MINAIELLVPLLGATAATFSAFLKNWSAKRRPVGSIVVDLGNGEQITVDGSEQARAAIRKILAEALSSPTVQTDIPVPYPSGEPRSAVESVLKVLNDGTSHFREIAEKASRPELREFFLSEADSRATFAQELKALLSSHQNEGASEPQGSRGSTHRVWGDLKAMLGNSERALLETAEQGEDQAKRAYQEALQKTAFRSPQTREVLMRQLAYISESQAKVKAFQSESRS